MEDGQTGAAGGLGAGGLAGDGGQVFQGLSGVAAQKDVLAQGEEFVVEVDFLAEPFLREGLIDLAGGDLEAGGQRLGIGRLIGAEEAQEAGDFEGGRVERGGGGGGVGLGGGGGHGRFRGKEQKVKSRQRKTEGAGSFGVAGSAGAVGMALRVGARKGATLGDSIRA